MLDFSFSVIRFYHQIAFAPIYVCKSIKVI